MSKDCKTIQINYTIEFANNQKLVFCTKQQSFITHLTPISSYRGFLTNNHLILPLTTQVLNFTETTASKEIKPIFECLIFYTCTGKSPGFNFQFFFY